MYELKTNQTVAELCCEFSQDIDDVKEKKWLLPALCSHVFAWKKTQLLEETCDTQVHKWFNSLT